MKSVISLFSGAGGLDLGFELSGYFDIRLSVESHPTYSKTIGLNRGLNIDGKNIFSDNEVVDKNVEDLIESGFFSKFIGIDGVIGGPPCQPFSTIGKRGGLLDERSRSVFDFFAVIRIVRPRFFLFENVPNIAMQWNGAIVDQILKIISEIGGYQVKHKIIDMSDLGAATKRRRFLLFGFTSDVNPDEVFITHPEKKKTVGDVFKNLPPTEATREAFPTDHVEINHTPEVAKRFSNLRQGEQCKIRKRWRLDLSQPSNSLMAGGNGGYVLHIHPTENRELTLREAASIQGFPLDYLFAGKKLDVAKQIVNAVPVEAALTIATQIGRGL